MISGYTSPELHHFVGRKHLSDLEVTYNILTSIIGEGHIRSPSAPEPRAVAFDIDLDGSLLDGTMFNPNCVCFCDIPADQLKIHVSKYGPFGLSFDKLWMIQMRARPVTYFPVFRGDWQTPIDGRGAIREIEAVYKSLQKLTADCSQDRTWGKIATTPEEAMVAALSAFDHNVLSFLKLFGPEWPDDSPHQYYMEREWRILGSLMFQISDIRRVFLPPNFVDRFKRDFPSYNGRIQEVI